MKTAEQFIKDHEFDTYEQLAIIKNKLIKDLEDIANGLISYGENIKPKLEEIFNSEREYLIAIEPLLDRKYIEEYINN